MTRKALLAQIRWVVAVYVIAVAAGVVLRWFHPAKDDVVYGTYKDLLPFFIAIPAAWLGYCFQRRSSYLQALRAMFDKVLSAANAAVEYTRWESEPTEADFRKTIEQLSVGIDAIRGVFENVPQPAYPLGFFPYEALKSIREIVGWLGYGSNWRDHKNDAHECIAKLWGVMHSALLLECDRAVPIFPVSRYLGNDLDLADKLINGTLRNEDFAEADKKRDELLVEMRHRL